MTRAGILLTIIMAVLIMAATGPQARAATHTGTVVETVTGGGYTYMKINDDGGDLWIAGPTSAVAKGETVSFSEQVWMVNFTSKALGRTFPKILFVSGVQAAPSAASAAPASSASAADVRTIGEIISKKDELKGRAVSVRGNVVKVSENIMGRTWVHIEDGSGERLIFRSINGTAEVGSVVTATGRLETDSDFGFGYFYPVIVEDATFSK